MHFKDLVDQVIALDKPTISFDFLREKVNQHHAGVGTIKVWSVLYDTPNRQAFYRLVDTDRESAYGDEFDEAEIRYCRELDEHPRERRYALTKELTHVFDTAAERVDTKEKFKTLLREIQNQPMPDDESLMYRADVNTRWKAAILLCPKKYRDEYKAKFDAGEMAEFEIAEKFMVPSWIISFVMDDYYDKVYADFIK
jgi:hypothetical protein